ncbi:hypothetical protein [Ralstonia phage RP31]|uniref:Uncharacterized protein n=1 Tax=Ralstonia phage RP31 TaxID=1923890 RepID=A0A1L7N206_9CAUD|nr:hypothetical protein [Ralstonia phage RP31]
MAERQKVTFQRLTDHDWLRQSFMITHGTQTSSSGDPTTDDVKIRTRFFSTAEFKFADTRLGGNVVINPAPQFTRLADPRIRGLYRNSNGMGRYYSEVIDDNKRIITMTFGVPQFNSLSTFYRGFYDHNAATVARTGRAPSVFYTAGQAIGFVAGLLSPWLVLYSLGSAFIKVAMNQPSSKYYFFKPSMASYWNAVSGVANDLAVKTQLISRKLGDPWRSPGDTRSSQLSDQDLSDINRFLYDVIDSYDEETGQGNGINVYAVATRYTRIQRAAFRTLESYYKSRSAPDQFATTVDEEGKNMLQQVSDAINRPELRRPKTTFKDYMDRWTASGSPGAMEGAGSDKLSVSLDNGGNNSNTNSSTPPASGDAAAPQGTTDLLTEKSISSASESDQTHWYDFLIAEQDDGAQYVSFRVENTGEQQESFSNQAGESEISSKINSISGAARSTRFSAADGNIGGGIAGQFVQGVISSAKDVAMGAANSLGIDGIAALGGNAFADIPKYWMNSTTSMPRMNYRIKLISPYGNRYSRFVNMWLPLSMLLAGSLPLSAGPHSYTAPFLCQLYDRGRAQTRLGMIDQLSVTRGGGNLGFNKIGEPMSIEVSFSVVELGNILHMPIAKSFNPIQGPGKLISTIFDNESLYNDYIATLSSLSLAEQIYVGERLKIGVTKYLKDADSWFSVPHAMNWFGDLAPVRAFSAFFNGVANR